MIFLSAWNVSSMEHNGIYRLLGNNISYYRKRANMTQLDLAEKIGISRTHMSNIESPNVPTPFTTTVLFRIADVLGVEVKQLFDFGRVSQE